MAITTWAGTPPKEYVYDPVYGRWDLSDEWHDRETHGDEGPSRVLDRQARKSAASTAGTGAGPEGGSVSLPTTDKERKALPVFTGVLMYFPDAIAAVAEVSRVGNEQHNPG